MTSASGAKSNKAAAERGSPAAESAAAEGGEHNMVSMAGDIVYLKTEMNRLKNIVETLSPGAALKSAGVPSNSSENDMAASDAVVDDAIVVDEEKAIETPYLPNEALKSAGAPSNSTVDEMAGRDAAVDDVAVVDELETGGDESAAAPAAAAKKKKKKKKKKRAKAKGRGAKVWNWCHGNLTKITAVGSLAVVLLVSASFGQGLLGDQFPSLRKGADPTRSLSGAETGAPPSNNAPEASDATLTPPSAKQPTPSLEPTSSSSLDGCLSDPNTCGCNHLGQSDYRGSINVAKNGVACKRWDQTVLFLPTDYPGAGLEENFCRNPDTLYRGAGCVTIEGGWDYCDVPVCEVSHAPEASDATSTPSSAEQPNKSIKPTTTSSVIPSTSLHPTSSSNSIEASDVILSSSSAELPSSSIKPNASVVPSNSLQPVSSSLDVCLSDPNTCGCIHLGQSDYRGSINVANNGVACMRWDVALRKSLQEYPDAGLEENFCRNPYRRGFRKRAWCVTIEWGWDYCDVPICEASCSNADPENCGCKVPRQEDYRGSISTTNSGHTCQRWDSQTPHWHDEIPLNYPHMGLEDNNYCRNPTGDLWRAWCHTTDPDIWWDYCDVPYCEDPSMTAERSALLDIYDYEYGRYYDSIDYCKWYGVTCNNETPPSIIELYLSRSNSGMTGTLSESIGNLRSLKRLDLCDNKIGGSIPTEIGNLINLEWLDLSNNEISGTIPSIPELRSLKRLDLCDNNIGGSIPTEIGNLTNLEWLDLSNNAISGTMPSFRLLLSLKHLDLRNNNIGGEILFFVGLYYLEFIDLSYNSFEGYLDGWTFENMSHLDLLHLHGNNKLTVVVENPAFYALLRPSSFVADCGEPSSLDNPIICETCTMCCNSQGSCALNDFKINHEVFAVLLTLGLLVLASLMALASFLYNKYGSPTADQEAANTIDEEHALKIIGKDSVYQFFLGSSWWGWAIALATIAAQIWMLTPFLSGADPLYIWKCPPDSNTCSNTISGDIDWQGWVLFGILTAVHLLKDIINGSKMIILSGKEMGGGWSRFRHFTGGFCMIFVTSFTLYISAIYNSATATSNTDLIINSVIILFVITVDECIYAIFKTMSRHGVENMSSQVPNEGQETHLISAAEKRNEECLEELKQQNEELKENVEHVESEIDDLRSQLDLLTQGRVDATVAQATQGSEGDGASDESED